MTSHSLLRSDTIGDVMILELGGSAASLSDYTLLNDFDEVRKLRREMGSKKVVFDLSQAPLFGSSLLELIRILWNDLSPIEGKLVLCNASAFGREVLGIAKFDQLWPLVETRKQALELLSPEHNVANWSKNLQELITQYDGGPDLIRNSIRGFTSTQLRTPSPPGVWSVLQIICHIADFELVYADRMKRVIAEDQPTMFGGDPDLFAAKLAYAQRDPDEELELIASVRKSTSRFLKSLNASDFDRVGVHSVDGPISLGTLLQRIAGHIPHHVELIEGKKKLLVRG